MKIYVVYASAFDGAGYGHDYSNEWVAGISLTKEGAEKIKSEVIFDEIFKEDECSVYIKEMEMDKTYNYS